MQRLFGVDPPQARGAADPAQQLQEYWRWRIEAMAQFPVAKTDQAISHVFVGEMDRALDLLWEAFEMRSAAMVFLATDPSYDPLRGLERFDDLLDRVGAP